jgi:hypothetical protein
MQPDGLEQNFYFGGGATETSLTVITLILLCIGIALVLLLPRRRILLPFFVISLLVPVTQVLVIPGMHLAVYRILLFAIWIRIVLNKWILRRDTYSLQMNSLDKVFIAWAICNAITYSLLWMEVGALINRLGFLTVSLGVYFMLRYAIRDREEAGYAIRALAVATIPIAVAMLYEHFTGGNLVSLLLGMGQQLAEIRNDRIRAQGPFSHSIVAGTFAAMLLPLFVGLWFEGKGNRLRAFLGALSATLITIASSSSTPLMTYCAGIVGICFWPFRRWMRLVRWAIVMSLIFLQIVMKAPVWFLINRISGLIGGTGWHRAELIDQFLRRFFEWFLIGTQNNANWGLDMWDAINAYVKAGVEGGLITFVLFLAIIVIGYRRIGLARHGAEQTEPQHEFFIWTLGVTLFSNTVAFFGIIYFDQSVVAWYCLLAMISVVSNLYIKAPEPAVSHSEIIRSMRPSPVPTYQLRNKSENQRTALPYSKNAKPAVD